MKSTNCTTGKIPNCRKMHPLSKKSFSHQKISFFSGKIEKIKFLFKFKYNFATFDIFLFELRFINVSSLFRKVENIPEFVGRLVANYFGSSSSKA